MDLLVLGLQSDDVSLVLVLDSLTANLLVRYLDL